MRRERWITLVAMVTFLTSACQKSSNAAANGSAGAPIDAGTVDGGTDGGSSSESTHSISAAPTAFVTSAITSTSIGIGWTDNATNELIYEVQKCDGTACTTFADVTRSPFAANVISHTETGLTPDSLYRFRVRSTNKNGSSAWLTSGDILTQLEPAKGLTLVSSTGTSLSISWTQGGSVYTSFEVQKCAGSNCTNFANVAASPLSAAAVTHTETGLTGGSVYRLRLRGVTSANTGEWLTSGDLTTKVTPASCASPTTTVVDMGLKTNSVNTGRGLWADVKIIPGTTLPATAYYDGTATGGTATIKFSWWNGSKFIVEHVAGDNRVVASPSARFLRLAFLSSGRPMVFWTNGASQIKAAIRSAAPNVDSGIWTAGIIDSSGGVAARSLEVAVSPLDQVGIIYINDTAATGRARFIYCDSGCTSVAGFVPMTAGTDTIEAGNVMAGFIQPGIGWCKHNATTYYPAVTYPGGGGAAIRYASCLGALTTCKAASGWLAQQTTVTGAGGLVSKLLLDSTTIGDAPKILSHNAGNTAIQVFQMNQACNAAPAYTFTANGVTFGSGTIGNAWASIMRSPSSGMFNVIVNNAAAGVSYYNSLTNNLATTTWNAVGTIDTLALPAAGAGWGGADIVPTTEMIYSVFAPTAGGSNNLTMGVLANSSLPSGSASSIAYSVYPDTTGGVQLEVPATAKTRNVAAASTNTGRPAVAYVDNSIGGTVGTMLKYAYRNGTTAASTWIRSTIPNTTSPMFPSLAFDNFDKPWIAYYDASTFRYNLITNANSDGSGDWTFYQFPYNGKTAGGTAPATDETALAMYYSGGVAQPLMITMNSNATGPGIRAALFTPATQSFSGLTLIDNVGGSFWTRLTAANDANGNVVIAYYDITSSKVKFNYTTNGISWLASSTTLTPLSGGREGLTLAMDPVTGRPAVSYYDRANNSVYFARCTTALALCANGTNWTPTTLSTTAGVSGITATTNEQLLNTGLAFGNDGSPLVTYMTGVAATTPALTIASAASSAGTFTSSALRTSPNVTTAFGADPFNFGLDGLNVSTVVTPLGSIASLYVGRNNWLFATTCGD